MIKITNEDDTGRFVEYTIALSSVQGGVLLEIDKYVSEKHDGSSTVLISPMSAAKCAYELEQSNGFGCSPICPEGHDFWIRKLVCGDDANGRRCLEYPAEVLIGSDDIRMVAPRFVTYALVAALKGLMGSLLFPSTGKV